MPPLLTSCVVRQLLIRITLPARRLPGLEHLHALTVLLWQGLRGLFLHVHYWNEPFQSFREFHCVLIMDHVRQFIHFFFRV